MTRIAARGAFDGPAWAVYRMPRYAQAERVRPLLGSLQNWPVQYIGVRPLPWWRRLPKRTPWTDLSSFVVFIAVLVPVALLLGGRFQLL